MLGPTSNIAEPSARQNSSQSVNAGVAVPWKRSLSKAIPKKSGKKPGHCYPGQQAMGYVPTDAMRSPKANPDVMWNV